MNETYTLLFKEGKTLCIVFPSLGLSAERLKERARGSRREICLVNYSGFGSSGGSFPGRDIVPHMDALIGRAVRETGKKVTRIVGDSYGGLIALGLMERYGKRYGDVEFVLTSPVISFSRLEKDPDSPQSKEGFVRYLKDHELIGDVDRAGIRRLVEHKEIPDPFKSRIRSKRLTIYHYDGDRSLSFDVSKSFARQKGARLIRLKGKKHALANFSRAAIRRVIG